MYSVLLSINPEFANKILDGEKKYELRRKKCKRHVDKIIIYSTSPIMSIVGEADVIGIIVDNPNRLWEKVYESACVDRDFYDEYYKNCDNAVAYHLGDIRAFTPPKSLEDYGVTFAPQSYIYINEHR